MSRTHNPSTYPDGFIRGLVFWKAEITFPLSISVCMMALPGRGNGTGLSPVHLFQRISGSVPSEKVKRGKKWDERGISYDPLSQGSIQTRKKRWNRVRFCFTFSFSPPLPFYSHGFDVKKANVTSGKRTFKLPKSGRTRTTGSTLLGGQGQATWQKMQGRSDHVRRRRRRKDGTDVPCVRRRIWGFL